MKRGVRTLLDRYLARPAHDTVLVLVSPSGVKPDKTLSAHATAVEYSPLTGDRLPRWVKVEHAGHTIQGDNPRGLVRVLKEFLAEIEQARSRRAPREFVAPRFRGCGEKRRGEPIVMVTAS